MSGDSPNKASFTRPDLPPGFDESRASERRSDPEGWRFSDQVSQALSQAIEGRRDIRKFRPDPVPRQALIRLLYAAHRAPSVGYMQPWRFVVIESIATRTQMRALCERERLRQADKFDDRARHFLELKVEGIVEAPLGVCVCCDRGNEDTEVLGRGTILDTDLYSTACAIQNLWLTARTEGLGVGWVSFYRPQDLRDLLDIPARVEPVAYLCIGYPDERPKRPGLESAGWESRLSLDGLIYEERYGHTAQNSTSQDQAPTDARASAPLHTQQQLPTPIEDLTRAVGYADHSAALAARDYSDELVKPQGSLGALEQVVERFSAATGTAPAVPLRAGILVLAADHGVANQQVSLFSQTVSTQVAEACARNTTAIGVLARARGDELVVCDLGLAGAAGESVLNRRIAAGTRDMTEGAAMSEAQTEQAILSGAELASDLIKRTDCLVLGEIGIGNTTAASALLAGLTGATPIQVCGRGTGLDSQGLERKRSVVERALKANPVEGSEPFQIVSRLGGFELAGLCGAILKACAHRRMVILDGFSVAVAALCAVRLCPAVRDYLIASHLSSESAHELALNELGLEALFDLRLRLGEASGAALALPLIESAGRLHREMQTFSGAGVERSR